MNTCYYYQDLLTRPVQALSTAPFNPTGLSALLVYSMIARVWNPPDALLGTRPGMISLV
jgi:hypothetical protein